MKEFVSYTLLRILLFVVTYAVLGGVWILFGGSVGTVTAKFILVVVAALISSVLSLKLLARYRLRFASMVDGRASRAAAKWEEIKAREDAD